MGRELGEPGGQEGGCEESLSSDCVEAVTDLFE